MGGLDSYTWSVPMTMERGSMASLDSTLRKGPPTSWRQPELPEVIAMLNYRLDPVKTNAAAFLQHLTFKNDKVTHGSHSNIEYLHFTLVLFCWKCVSDTLTVCSCVSRLSQRSVASRVSHPWCQCWTTPARRCTTRLVGH